MRRFLTVAVLIAVSTATPAAGRALPKTSPGFDSTDSGELIVYLSTPFAVDFGLPFTYTVYYWNRTSTLATNGVIRISLPAGASYRAGPDYCSATGETVVCHIGDIPAALAFSNFAFDVVAPVAAPSLKLSSSVTFTAEQAGIETSVNGSLTTPVYDAFKVITTADSGAGSLREAILSANAGCTDGHACKIAFAIPDPPIDGVQTIRPLTALPHLAGWNITVDGTTQTGYFGDSNPAGPEVQILGDQVGDASDGLVIETFCNAYVQGLVVSGFTGAGIKLLDDRCPNPYFYQNLPPESEGLARTISGNYIGTDPTGTRAVPNTRGIMAQGAAVTPMRIDGNVISGNVRSGIFLESGRGSYIVGNTIGLTATHTAPLGNGASGIYIGPDAAATDVAQNMIAFNHDSGISVAAPAVALSLNSIFANYQLAIDLGLDGPTPPSAALGGAVLTSARYDPVAGVTFIEGEITGGVGISRSTIDFFANDAVDAGGYAQAKYVLGSSGTDASNYRHFLWSYPADLRGKYISATVTRNDYFGFATIGPTNSWQGFVTTTSEVSKALAVQ